MIHANYVITWGVARWGLLEGHILYEKHDIMETFHIVPPYIQIIKPFLFESLQFRDYIFWKTILSIIGRCDVHQFLTMSLMMFLL